ncbi:hypothetical protein DFH09DRAFT_1082662 [Mycena vulgaris]|nr:hypothetical protein DFH09DRAFT_1082662 [Mycena vulgaris]
MSIFTVSSPNCRYLGQNFSPADLATKFWWRQPAYPLQITLLRPPAERRVLLLARHLELHLELYLHILICALAWGGSSGWARTREGIARARRNDPAPPSSSCTNPKAPRYPAISIDRAQRLRRHLKRKWRKRRRGQQDECPRQGRARPPWHTHKSKTPRTRTWSAGLWPAAFHAAFYAQWNQLQLDVDVVVGDEEEMVAAAGARMSGTKGWTSGVYTPDGAESTCGGKGWGSLLHRVSGPYARRSRRPCACSPGSSRTLTLVNPIYCVTIKLLYTFPQSVGLAGGRPPRPRAISGSILPRPAPIRALAATTPPRAQPATDADTARPRPQCARRLGQPRLRPGPGADAYDGGAPLGPADVALHERTAHTDSPLEPPAPTTSAGASTRPPAGGALTPAEEAHFLRAHSAAELPTFHCERVRKMPLPGLDPRMLIGFVRRYEAEWVDLRRRVSELPRTIFSIQDEPAAAWPGTDDDDDMGLESVSNPEEVADADDAGFDDGDVMSASHAVLSASHAPHAVSTASHIAASTSSHTHAHSNSNSLTSGSARTVGYHRRARVRPAGNGSGHTARARGGWRTQSGGVRGVLKED